MLLNDLQTDAVMNSGNVVEFRTELLDGETVWRCEVRTEHEFNDYYAVGYGRTPEDAYLALVEGDDDELRLSETGERTDPAIKAAFHATCSGCGQTSLKHKMTYNSSGTQQLCATCEAKENQ